MSAAIPVARFAYRRAYLLVRTMAAAHSNGVKRINVFSEGPRDDTVADDVQFGWRLLRLIDWTECRVAKGSSNPGWSESLLSGILKDLAEYNEIVVCEDDIELAGRAYGFLCVALEWYRDEPRRMCVDVWTRIRVTPPSATDVPNFSPRFGRRGWGTWRCASNAVRDHTSRQLRLECLDRGIDVMRVGYDLSDGADLEDVLELRDLRLSLHMLRHDGPCLIPPPQVSFATRVRRRRGWLRKASARSRAVSFR